MNEKKLVFIKWVDSSAHSLGWTDETNLDLVPITTVGFLLKEDEDGYTISHSIGFGGLHFDAFVIPKGCVKSIKELNASKK